MKENKINMVYYFPDEKENEDGSLKWIKKSQVFECCEYQLVLKTFEGIRKRIIDNMGSKEQLMAHLEDLSQQTDVKQKQKEKAKAKEK